MMWMMRMVTVMMMSVLCDRGIKSGSDGEDG